MVINENSRSQSYALYLLKSKKKPKNPLKGSWDAMAPAPCLFEWIPLLFLGKIQYLKKVTGLKLSINTTGTLVLAELPA
jgi:hypothetical protein